MQHHLEMFATKVHLLLPFLSSHLHMQKALQLQDDAVRQTQRSIRNEWTSGVPKCIGAVGVIKVLAQCNRPIVNQSYQILSEEDS
jgi:hypothetical protein